MSGHSPAPWGWHGANDDPEPLYAYDLVINDADNNDLAQLFSKSTATVFITDEQAKANARLIAAAPDLLKALVEMIEPWNGFTLAEIVRRADPPTYNRIICARAAIAAATGETP